MNIEVFEWQKLGTAIQPHLVSQPEIANYGWREYGNRVGIHRMFELFSRLKVPVTAALNAEVALKYPEIIQGMKKNKWSLMGHGWNNSSGHCALSLQEEKNLIDKTMKVFQEHFQKTPKGWLTPGFSISHSTYQILKSYGVEYVTDWVCDDQPFYYDISSSDSMKVLPYSIETNDITLCLTQGYTAQQMCDELVQAFDCLYREGQKSPKVMAVGLHPFIVGQPNRVAYLEKFYKYARSKKQTYFAHADDIASLV